MVLDLLIPGPDTATGLVIPPIAIIGLAVMLRLTEPEQGLTGLDLAAIMLAGKKTRGKYRRLKARSALTRSGGGVDSGPNDHLII
jgi:hypothetical protein